MMWNTLRHLGLVTLLLLVGAPAFAQTEVLPYSGQLVLNGEPVNGDVEMRFRIFSNGPSWLSTYGEDGEGPPVTVSRGEFRVLLGQYENDIAETLAAGNPRMSVAVRLSSDDEWESFPELIPMGGSVYTLWTDRADFDMFEGSLTVDTLSVQDTANLDGNTQVDILNVETRIGIGILQGRRLDGVDPTVSCERNDCDHNDPCAEQPNAIYLLDADFRGDFICVCNDEGDVTCFR